jgi:hypothetical protein
MITLQNKKHGTRMTARLLKSLTFLSAFFLVGCQTLPPLDFTVQDVGPLTNRKDAEMRSLTVGYAPQTQQKRVESNHEIPPIWKEALTDALNRSLAFRDDADTRVNVSVRIVELDVPAAGFDMATTAGAIYEIVDRETGDLLFAETITTEGVVPLDYAFVGVVRAMESVNRAVRNNIAEFINRLEDADIKTPIYEAN